MRITFKKTLVALLVSLLGLSVAACQNKTTLLTGTNGAVLPQLSSPDKIFIQGEHYQVTYQDIYEEFKTNDGINQLLFLVDSDLLKTYIDDVTSDEIAKKIKYLKYGTSDDEAISELTEDELADAEALYNDNMLLLGYQGNEEAYVRLIVAKENYTKTLMLSDDNNEETWYVGETTIANKYEATYYPDVAGIKIRFYGETDAKNVLKTLNLVSYQGTLRRYIGSIPITSVASDGFNDTNTQVLTNDELIDAFIELYNYVYGDYKTELSVDATLEELIANPDLALNYDDLYAAKSTLAGFVFTTLSSVQNPNETLFYTYQPVKYAGTNDSSYYMILKLNDSDKVDLSDFDAATDDLATLIGQDVYDELEELMIEINLKTTDFVSQRLAEMRADNNLVIYDYYLGMDYQGMDANYELNEEGDSSMVATYNGKTITADDLFTSAMNKNAALYSIYASQLAVVMDRHYADVYCYGMDECETDIAKSNSEKLAEHAVALQELKTSFEASYYTYYYTFDEYIYLAYGAKSEADMISRYYMKSTLQPYVIYDELVDNDWDIVANTLYDQITEYYDNYFSLDIEYLLIYLDRDESGTPDNYTDFIADLTDEASHQAMVDDFEGAIRSYLSDEEMTYDDLISEYVKAKRDDATWGRFKQYGFQIVTDNLGVISYLTTKDAYEPALVEGFSAAYQEYLLEDNVEKDAIYYSELVESSDGLYLLYAQQGTDFDRPSAYFEMTYDHVVPNYTLGIENDSDRPSLSQVKLFTEARFYEIVYGTDTDLLESYGITAPKIPTSVRNAIEAYYETLHDSMYVVGFLNIVVGDELQSASFVNQTPAYCSLDEATIKTQIQTIRDLYDSQVFPED